MALHRPVLLDAAIEGLAVRPAGRYIDGTYGRGGHTAAIVARLGPEGRLLAIDRDPEAVAHGLEHWGADPRVRVARGNFDELAAICRSTWGEIRVDGVLLDVGVSSPQLDDPRRGFGFRATGPLDMRMDPERGESAADFLARGDEREIADVLWRYGEERQSRRIARAIVSRRESAPITTTTALAELVAAVVGGRREQKHPATRVFQALRIHVNRELDALASALPQAVDLLQRGGRLCVIAFHSLEDRLVKRFMRDASREDPVYAGLPDVPEHARPRLNVIGRAQRPDAAEVEANPRARSAVLRIAERL